ncbi:hypothetical protein PGT21_029347 [Puccinia graminis f. sp. tritici]|uniref:Uncharacterized protein n=1 Tax=Puccinia graminis f. sp. tritici TaxID=56615 RepID=A0A5B0QBT1_PUCGR|nr:hypothetical protein PGT21_029347 [Puccinia graminis f. sp. tritici]
MQFFSFLLCTLMSPSVLTVQGGLGSAGQRRSLDHEIKENWMVHKRNGNTPAAPAGGAAPTGGGSKQWLVGGSITQADVRGLLMEFLKSSVTPGAAPRSSQVGKTKALEIFSRLEASQKADPPPPLTPKAAQSFAKLLKRSESMIMGGGGAGKSSKSARRAAPPEAGAPKSTTPSASGTKNGRDLLKAFIDTLPEAKAASAGGSPARAGKSPK